MGIEKEKRHARQSRAKGSSKKHPSAYGDFKFINISPTKADGQQAKQAYEAGELSTSQIWAWISDGFDYKVSYDAKDGSWKAQFTDMRDDSETWKHILPMRSSSPEAATLKLLFYMEFRFDTTWRVVAQGDTDAEDWF